uniref:YHS domain-containing (seleno)protein n=1 Tax=Marinobacterium profundum TaxID=1714300 RepID=UPI00082CFDCA|nr:YHS domain-containing (seleno)protein [Marinobacterium profundum]
MRQLIAAVFLLFAVSVPASEAVSTSRWDTTAIGGHDTVAYHEAVTRKNHQQIAGEERFEVQWKGATWRFASQASADRFAADPDRYRPEYNGHCANALSLGEGLISTDGTVWEFFGDQLFLFYAERGRQRWLSGNWQSYKTEADSAWDNLKMR